MKVIIGHDAIYADGYIAITEEKAVQFYVENRFCGFPPIKVDEKMLSDFGKEILCSKKYEK